LYRGKSENPVLVWVPPTIDPYAVPTVVLAAAGTPTDATVVGESGLIRRVLGSAVTQEQGATGATLRGVCHGPLGRVAVGDGATVQVHTGESWLLLPVKFGKGALRAVACTSKGAIAVGDKGQVVTVDLASQPPSAVVKTPTTADLHAAVLLADGEVWLAGDVVAGSGPVLLRKTADGEGWQSAWPSGVFSATVPDLRALVPLANDALLLLDREGGVHRLDATGLHGETGERKDLRPRAGITLDNGRTVLVGQPGLWLGPFLTIATIDKPGSGGNPAAVPVEWSYQPGPLPSFTRVHLDVNGNGFPIWWIYVEPKVSALVLPDFSTLKGINVFPPNVPIQYVARIDRVYVPGFSINGFATFELEFGAWRSWSTNAKPFAK